MSITRPEVRACVKARDSRQIYPVGRIVGAEHARVSEADPYELGAGRKRPDGNRTVDVWCCEMQGVCVLQIDRFEPTKQAAVKNVDQLIDTMVHN